MNNDNLSYDQVTEESSTEVKDLSDADLIRVFTIKLAEYNDEHDYSRKKCLYDVAREFRDEHEVNMLRALKRNGFQHPDGYRFNVQLQGGEELLQMYDPVTEEARKEDGTADFRPGDIIELDGDGLVVIAVGESSLAALNKSGKLDTHALATVRNLFTREKYDARLIRDGEVVRGVPRVRN